MNQYVKYFAARDATDRWLNECISDLREVGERYLTLLREINSASGRGHSLFDQFPMAVDEISEYGDKIHVSGHWTRRGCTDSESCDLPKALVYGTEEEREAIFAELEQKLVEAKDAAQREAEEEERAEYEKLREKFG